MANFSQATECIGWSMIINLLGGSVVTVLGHEPLLVQKYLKKWHPWGRKIISVVFSPLLIFLEEMFFWYKLRQKADYLGHVRFTCIPYKQLNRLQKKDIRDYFSFYEEVMQRKTQIVRNEAKIQLVLQNALIIYQFVKFPMIEFQYSNSDPFFGGIPPSTRWIGQCLKYSRYALIFTALIYTIFPYFYRFRISEK